MNGSGQDNQGAHAGFPLGLPRVDDTACGSMCAALAAQLGLAKVILPFVWTPKVLRRLPSSFAHGDLEDMSIVR